jgi:hypothetical protein
MGLMGTEVFFDEGISRREECGVRREEEISRSEECGGRREITFWNR